MEGLFIMAKKKRLWIKKIWIIKKLRWAPSDLWKEEWESTREIAKPKGKNHNSDNFDICLVFQIWLTKLLNSFKLIYQYV